MRHGFTLIELLVVVLIIGILAAIALPQYQKAVWKSKNAQLKILAKTYLDAQNAYHMANGTYAKSFSDLDIQMPDWTSTNHNTSICPATTSEEEDSVRYNGEIRMLISTNGNFYIFWMNGPYKCGGFYTKPSDNQILCTERAGDNGIKNKGTFCTKLENATFKDTPSSWRFFTMP